MADDVDVTPKHFSTDDVPERERLAQWREEFARTLVRVDIEPLASDAPFRAEASLQRLPGVHVASCTGSPARLDRNAALVAAHADADDTIGLIINGETPTLAAQRGAELVLNPGDAVLVRHDEACALSNINRISHVGFLLPRAALAMRTENLDAAMMKRIAADDPALRLLRNYVRLVQSDPGLARPALREAIVNHVHDLAALLLGPDRDTGEHGQHSVGAARLKQAIADIGRHFTDPGLTIAAVAQRQGISPRYLQELFERSGASFVARVNELRLKRAFALLTRLPDRPVAEIAMQAGFSNVSHFNRLFRQRFGDSPSGVRGSA